MTTAEFVVGAVITSPLWGRVGYHLAGEAWHWLRTPQQRWVEPQPELETPSIPPPRSLVLDAEPVEVTPCSAD